MSLALEYVRSNIFGLEYGGNVSLTLEGVRQRVFVPEVCEINGLLS